MKEGSNNLIDKMVHYKVPAENEYWIPDGVGGFFENVDWLYNWITIISVVFFAAIIFPMWYYTWKYNRKSVGDKALNQHDHSFFLEILWSGGPLIILFVMFYYGFQGYLDMRIKPNNAMEVGVRAYQWGWEFSYNEDFEGNATKCETKVSFNEPLLLPTGRAVNFLMTSSDVLHSFYLPNFRQKGDVIPGRYNTVWVEAPEGKEGTYPLFCTEFCGTSHSQMLAEVRFVKADEFNAWLKSKEKVSCGGVSLERGKNIYSGVCQACHSLDGSKKVGPSFKGLWGREEKIEGGSSVTVDENYIKESILNPNAKIVEGYPPSMPAQELDEDEIKSVIKFIKEQK